MKKNIFLAGIFILAHTPEIQSDNSFEKKLIGAGLFTASIVATKMMHHVPKPNQSPRLLTSEQEKITQQALQSNKERNKKFIEKNQQHTSPLPIFCSKDSSRTSSTATLSDTDSNHSLITATTSNPKNLEHLFIQTQQFSLSSSQPTTMTQDLIDLDQKTQEQKEKSAIQQIKKEFKDDTFIHEKNIDEEFIKKIQNTKKSAKRKLKTQDTQERDHKRSKQFLEQEEQSCIQINKIQYHTNQTDIKKQNNLKQKKLLTPDNTNKHQTTINTLPDNHQIDQTIQAKHQFLPKFSQNISAHAQIFDSRRVHKELAQTVYDQYTGDPHHILKNFENNIIIAKNTIQNINSSFSTQCTFTPKHHNSKKVIFYIATHGTFSNSNSLGTNENALSSAGLYAHAQQLALQEDATVYFYTLDWNGQLDINERKKAGIKAGLELQNHINLIKQECNNAKISIHTLGHSHGNNVNKFMSQTLYEHGITVDQDIVIASPISDIPENFCRKRIKIIGKNDAIAHAGSMISQFTKKASKQNLHETNQPDDTYIEQTITLMHEDQHLNHATTKTITALYLPLITNFSKNCNPAYSYFIATIYDQNKHNIEQDSMVKNDGDYDLIGTQVEMQVPHYAIAGIVDERKQIIEENDIARQENNLHTLNNIVKEQAYYAQPNIIHQITSECQTRNINHWFLKLIQPLQTSLQLGYTLSSQVYNSSLNFYIRKDVLEDPALYNMLASTRERIEKETSWKEKSNILAKGTTSILEPLYTNENLTLEQVQKTTQIIKNELGHLEKDIQIWQNYYECIIGRTRTDISMIENLPATALNEFKQAQNIFKHIKQAKSENKSIKFEQYNYKSLSPYVQQALLIALEQELKITLPR